MDTLADNLKNLIFRSRLNEAELSRVTGISQPVINRITKGSTTNPNVDTLRPIAHYFNVTIDQLIGIKPLAKTGKPSPLSAQGKHVPVIQWRDAKEWQNIKSNYEVTRTMFVEHECSEATYCLIVRDDTMAPKFAEGALIAVDPTLKLSNRDFAIIQIGKQAPIFKQVLFDGSDVYLKSLNVEFPLVKIDKPFRCLGIVLEAHSYFQHREPIT